MYLKFHRYIKKILKKIVYRIADQQYQYVCHNEKPSTFVHICP